MAPTTELDEELRKTWSFHNAVAAAAPIFVTAKLTVKFCPNWAWAGAARWLMARSGPAIATGAVAKAVFVND